MKIKKIKNHSIKLIRLQLLKTKIFSKKQHSKNITVEDIEYRLKKTLQIIYKYHINNKTIAFIGTPHTINDWISTIFKSTKHVLIPEALWVNGILTNQLPSLKFLLHNKKIKNKKLSETLFKLKKNIDLIVVLNSMTNIDALEEGYNANIPIISLNAETNLTDTKSLYKLPGNFKFSEKTYRNNLFFSLLAASLNYKLKRKLI